MQEISIQQVLAEMETAQKPFLIKFVRSTGKRRGSIKTVAKAIKGGPKRRRLTPTGSSSRSVGLHKDKHTVPMTDIEIDQYLSPLISHIIQFQQYKVIH